MRRLDDLDEAALLRTAGQLARHLRIGDMICLSGALGAGKTTFARGLLYGLGLPRMQEVTSPTYTLVNIYAPPEVTLPVAHIDLYRLDRLEQVQGLGLDDMLEDHLLIVEWPERWGEDLPADHLHLRLLGNGDTRTLAFEGTAAWLDRLDALKALP
jgi:tRNA threonylcarbamoyladenosine biosynthesis protein TsaE